VRSVFKALVMGGAAVLAVTFSIKAQPALRCWGTGTYGATNIPSNLPRISAVSAGCAHTLALTSAGTVVAWGEESSVNMNYGQTNVPAGLSNVVSIAAGYANSLALQSDGTMTCWGQNPLTLTGIKAIAAGIHNVVLRNDGTVYAWGVDSYGECDVPAGLQNVVAIGAGPNHTLAVKADGTMVAWGKNNFGQTNVPPGLSNIVAVGGGDFHSVVLKSDGRVILWGDNRYSQTNMPANLSNVVGIAPGWYHTVALKADKTIVTWGYNANQQTNAPPGLSNVVAVSASAYDSFALAPYPPRITAQVMPTNTTVGGQLAFSIVTTGTPPILCQWWFNETNAIGGATNATLVLTNVTVEQAGVYGVAVTSDYGSTTSKVSVIVSKVSQSVTFDALPDKWVTDSPFLLSAFASSGLPVTFTSSEPSVATVSSNLVTIVGAGKTTVTASQSGDATYAPASTSRTLTVNRLGQTITFDPLPVHLITDPPFSLDATSDSGLAVSYSSSNPSAAAVSGNTVTIVGLGSTAIRASQSGNSTYSPAPNVDRVLTVNGIAPSIVVEPTNPVVVVPGETARFEVTAAGTAPLGYQWFTNRFPISGATNALLTVTNVQVEDMGSYQVVVSNAYGSVTSSVAGLFVVHSAVITAVVTNGFVVHAVITDGGYGYYVPPIVRVVGGGGNGAEILAVVSNGVVTGVAVLNAGFGYTDTPLVAIAPPFPLTVRVACASGLGFTNLIVGKGYQVQGWQSGGWSNAGGPFVAEAATYWQYLDGRSVDSLFRLVPLPMPYGAAATPVLAYGFMVAATVTDGGLGYVSVPNVAIVGGGGSGAQATATISNGIVSAVNVMNAGYGYTSAPSIHIDPPPVPFLLPRVAGAVRLDYDGLTPALTYQLRASSNLVGWADCGAPFTATANTNSQYLNAEAGAGFFRLWLR
jgi:hypothetical protein